MTSPSRTYQRQLSWAHRSYLIALAASAGSSWCHAKQLKRQYCQTTARNRLLPWGIPNKLPPPSCGQERCESVLSRIRGGSDYDSRQPSSYDGYNDGYGYDQGGSYGNDPSYYQEPSQQRQDDDDDWYGGAGRDSRGEDEGDYYYDDRGTSSPPASQGGRRKGGSDSVSSFVDSLPAFLKNGNRRIGLPLLGGGIVVTMLGMSLFFNKALLRLGNLLFISGVMITMGVGRTMSFFLKPEKMRATACLGLGIFLVFIGSPVFGMILEIFGLLNLFGNMFPMLLAIGKTLPGIGPLLNNLDKKRNDNDRGRQRSRDDDRYYDSERDRDYYDDRDDRDYYNDRDYGGGRGYEDDNGYY